MEILVIISQDFEDQYQQFRAVAGLDVATVEDAAERMEQFTAFFKKRDRLMMPEALSKLEMLLWKYELAEDLSPQVFCQHIRAAHLGIAELFAVEAKLVDAKLNVYWRYKAMRERKAASL